MPIRFRCAYCNQLMGIARRKAGTVVRCPSCAGQVVVPSPEGEAPAEAPAAGAPKEPLFERSDFDEIFQPAIERGRRRVHAPEPAPAPAAPPPLPRDPAAWEEPAAPPAEAEPLAEPPPLPSPASSPRRPGIQLSPALATGLSVAIIVGLALAFAAGLMVGLFLHAGSHEEPGDKATRPGMRLHAPSHDYDQGARHGFRIG